MPSADAVLRPPVRGGRVQASARMADDRMRFAATDDRRLHGAGISVWEFWW
jgi:hypothetical protein